MKLNNLKKDPMRYLDYVIRSVFNKTRNQSFEYIKLLLMLQKLRKPTMGGQMTKSIVNLRSKINNEKKLSFKLLAIIVDRIFTYRSREMKRDTMKILKDKEIQIYKVLFGKVTPVKQIHTQQGEKSSQFNPTRKSMVNSNSYVNFQRPSHVEHLSTNSKFRGLTEDGAYNRMIKSQMNPGTIDFYSDAQNMQLGAMRTSNYFKEEFPNPNLSNHAFMGHAREGDNAYHRRNMTHRPEDFNNRSHLVPPTRKKRGFAGKNSSVSMHNLNNFGFLKESGSIKVQKNKERPSIFRLVRD